MQNYDENYFLAKANKRARTTWITLMIIVTIYYVGKLSGGKIEAFDFAVFTIIGWAEYLTGRILLKIKGAHYPRYKWIVGLGYVIYFSFIEWMVLDEVSYIFILPLVSILILYKDPKLVKIMMWITMFILVSCNLYKGLVLGTWNLLPVQTVPCSLEL